MRRNQPWQHCSLKAGGPDARCFFLQGAWAFLTDGRVSTCCFDPFGTQILAEQPDDGLHKILGDAQQRLLAGHLDGLDVCQRCAWPRAGLPVQVPRFLKIELAAQCNLHCCYDPTRNIAPLRGVPFMADATLDQILDACRQYPIEDCWLYGYGESLLHPNLDCLLRRVREAFPAAALRLDTNGNFLRDSDAEGICDADLIVQFAIDGASQEVYGRHRKGGQLSEAIANLSRLVDLRNRRDSNAKIAWRFLVFHDNLHEIEKAKGMAKWLGVDQFSLAIGDTGVPEENCPPSALEGHESGFVHIEYRDPKRYTAAR